MERFAYPSGKAPQKASSRAQAIAATFQMPSIICSVVSDLLLSLSENAWTAVCCWEPPRALSLASKPRFIFYSVTPTRDQSLRIVTDQHLNNLLSDFFSQAFR